MVRVAADGEIDDEGGTRVRPAFGANRAAMMLDDATADREPDPGAASGLAAGELLEKIEDRDGLLFQPPPDYHEIEPLPF